MPRKKTKRDGWSGPTFRRLREERGRTVEWLCIRTSVTAQTVGAYERDTAFPPHAWRDDAAKALKVERGLLGVGAVGR